MLHRISGRATKCGPSAISAIAGVPTHEAAATIRRLFDRRSVNGVFMDELAAALAEFGWTPDYAIRHPKLRERRFARCEEAWERIFAGVPFDERAMTLGTFLDPRALWNLGDFGEQPFRGLCRRVCCQFCVVFPQAGPLVPRQPGPRPRCKAAHPRSRPVRARRPRRRPPRPGAGKQASPGSSGSGRRRTVPARLRPRPVPHGKEAPVTGRFLVKSRMFTLGIGAAMDSRFDSREEAEAYIERAMKHFPGSRYDIREDAEEPGPQPKVE